MTPGQAQAARELAQLRATKSDDFDLDGEPFTVADRLVASISIRVGVLEMREGGLKLRERESFLLSVPPGFPFDLPTLCVTHSRFAGFPHVIWSKWLCLYQSKLEWNPADGLFGFFDRLSIWLTRAAWNDMDPPNGPLEPPHHVTDFEHVPIVVRSRSPIAAGASWVGFATLSFFPNRLELDAWCGLDEALPADRRIAPAFFVSDRLPMEFPQNGAEFFAELGKQGIDTKMLFRMLSVAALLAPENEKAYLVLGVPMRRTPDGKDAHHVAVWAIGADDTKSLRLAIPKDSDSESLQALRQDVVDAVQREFEKSTLTWCNVFEDRPEIVVSRDANTPMAWFRGRSVLILGCGALGSWAAEMVARSSPRTLHLVDNTEVKPGLLVRQNFSLDDIGSSKAEALARRTRTLRAGLDVRGYRREAHTFLLRSRDDLAGYDMIIDCTASSIMQMKVERDWGIFGPAVARMCSFVIDAAAERFLLVSVGPDSVGGPWSAFLHLKHKICTENERSDIRSAFYSDSTINQLFQPEPGCSDPTFRGSSADVVSLVGAALNQLAEWASSDTQNQLVACGAPSTGSQCDLDVGTLAPPHVIVVGDYRVLVSRRALNEIRAAIRQNTRLRSSGYETGGLLWGYWDEACRLIVVFDASGPPPDSRHERAHFQCGVEGTVEEHERRSSRSGETSTFLGFWHTHPDFTSRQSQEDMLAMSSLVASVGSNQRRALMIIFGRNKKRASAGVFLYEAQTFGTTPDLIQAHETQVDLDEEVL